MATVFQSASFKNYLRDAMKDATDGLIRVQLWSDSAQVDDNQTVAWSNTTNAGEIELTTPIVFDVPAATSNIEGYKLGFWNGSAFDEGILVFFDSVYNYTNAGTFTISNITLSVS